MLAPASPAAGGGQVGDVGGGEGAVGGQLVLLGAH